VHLILLNYLDDRNQFISSQPDVRPNDNVQGFAIKDCENALRGDVRSFGAFYQRLVNSPTAQNQLAAFNELFSFYYSLTFDCSSANPYPNTKGGE